MNPSNLLKKAQSDHTSESLGATVQIVYSQSGQADVTTYCFTEEEELNKQDDRTRASEKIFTSVALPFDPKVNDIIICDGKSYKLVVWFKQLDRYILNTEANRTHIGKRFKQNV